MVSIQNNMQMHDELAALFSRNLTFNPQPQAPVYHEEPKMEQEPAVAATQPIVYSVSQHYNHSAHVVRPSSEPPQGETMSTEIVLKNHGVNPSTLTPSQIQLFRVADPPQKMRLLELWTICPPNQGGDIPSLAWSSTTLEQEEQLARVRYEKSNQNQVMSLDGTAVQSNDGKWIQNDDTDTEPYMASGYEELMRNEYQRQAQLEQARNASGAFIAGPAYTQATNPIYMGPDCVRQQQQLEMATQYGAFQHFRANEAEAMDVM